jgi:hypothetical protein
MYRIKPSRSSHRRKSTTSDASVFGPLVLNQSLNTPSNISLMEITLLMDFLDGRLVYFPTFSLLRLVTFLTAVNFRRLKRSFTDTLSQVWIAMVTLRTSNQSHFRIKVVLMGFGN